MFQTYDLPSFFSVDKDPLQVSYYEDTPEKFWLVHDFVKQNPL